MRSFAVAFCVATAFTAPLICSEADDASSILLLANRLHECFRSCDEASLLAFWSETSPQRGGDVNAAKKLFGDSRAAGILQSTSGYPVIDGDRARLRLQRTVTGTASPTAGSVGAGKLTLECIKENGDWKVWKLGPAEEELSTRIASAQSKQEREALLQSEPDLCDADLADSLIAAGANTSNRGDDEKAQSLYELALTVAERVGAQTLCAQALNNIGLTFYNRGDFQVALEWYNRSLTLSETLHDDVGIARTLNNMGAVYSDYDEFALALQNFQRSLTLAEKVNNPRGIAFAFGNMALIHAKRGDYVQALALMQRGFEWSQRTGSKRGQTTDMLNIGELFLRQNDYDQAKYHFERALALATAADLRRLAAIALLGLGQVAEYRGDAREAIAFHEKSLTLLNEFNDRPNAAMAISFLAMDYASTGAYSKAIQLFNESIEMQKAIGGGVDIALTYARLAAAYNGSRDFEAALRAANEALEIATAKEFKETIWRAHLEAGKASRGMKLAAQAESEFARAIAAIEDLRANVAGAEVERQTYFEDKLEAYHQMIEHLVALGRFKEAFGYAERAKARVLLDVLRSGRGQLASLLSPDELRQDQEMRLKLASLNLRITRERQKPHGDPSVLHALGNELDHIRQEYAAFQTGLNAVHPQWKWKLGEVEPLGPEETLALLHGGAARSIEYVVTDAAVYLFVVSAGQPEWLRVFTIPISRQQLSEKVERFHTQLAKRDLAFRSEASDLFKLLIAPASALLRNTKQLIIIPDSVLWDLPFQALLSGGGGYMLDEYSMVYAPSLSALKVMNEIKKERQRSPGETQLLAMGNPVWDKSTQERVRAAFRGQEYGNLPRAETEVRRLSEIYGASRSQIYIRAQARESRFKASAPNAKVVHLATHGVVNDASPLLFAFVACL